MIVSASQLVDNYGDNSADNLFLSTSQSSTVPSEPKFGSKNSRIRPWHVKVTLQIDNSLRVYWRIFAKIFVSTTSCIIINDNLLFCAACRWNKILSQKERSSQHSPVHTKRFVASTCHQVCGDLLSSSPSVHKVDGAIRRINLYPVDGAIGFPKTYPLNRDLSDG